jgi:hypothetical protein
VAIGLAWSALAEARTSRMTAVGRSESGDPWTRRGTGRISIHRAGLHLLEWEEFGSWQEGDERPTSFRNRLRWTWDVAQGTLQLHHLRRGAELPIHLGDLVPDGGGRFIASVPHLCGQDRYQAELLLSGERVELLWVVTGPAKRYSLSTTYHP